MAHDPYGISGTASVPSETLARLRTALAGRYEIQRELARGGMGQVYEARDLKHGRAVAIKILDPELAAAIGSARFRAEIETAARLVHPHIVPLFDSGEADGLFYYVMPLLGGESLRQRLFRERQLPVEDATRIAREVADALRYAHDQGLVHRDVKPENIVLTGGHAMVLDFGIARTAEAAQSAETRTVAAIGTPAYMSPEQSSGPSLDGRADQYALACVVYEMLTGQPPFTGATAENIALQHRTLEPRPVTALRPATPAFLDRALARALAKTPADRFPTIAAFADALTTAPTPRGAETPTPSGAAAGRLMLAVLPLENRSPDPEQEFFTDGMTEELITHLGRLQPKKLGVIARTSAMRYKKTQKSAVEIGRELSVEYLLEGSVRRAGERLRIAVQLIQVADQTHLWAESYDRRVADVFDLQSEVAETVAKALEVELLPGLKAPGASVSSERASAESVAPDSEAYDAYLKGRFYWNRRTPEALRLALEWFERAVVADPGFARAYAGIADVYHVLPTYGLMDAVEAAPKGLAAARRALELAPDLVEAKASMHAQLMRTSRSDAARELRRIIEVDPSYVPAYIWLGIELGGSGKHEEGIAVLERARRMDPLSAVIEFGLGFLYYLHRDYKHALERLQRSRELEQEFTASHFWAALSRVALGEAGEALSALDRLDPKLARSSDLVAARAYVLAALGRREEALAVLRALEERSKTEFVLWEWLAYAYMGLRDMDAYFALLEARDVVGGVALLRMDNDPVFEPVRSDPRFAKIRARLS